MHIFNNLGGKNTTCPLFMLYLSLTRQWHKFASIRKYPPPIYALHSHHKKKDLLRKPFFCRVHCFARGAMRVLYGGLFLK